jgi:membrane-associated protease RseP (regulator of RpoE activity)
MVRNSVHHIQPIKAVWALGWIAVLASGCVNPYIRNYQPAEIKNLRFEKTTLLAPSGEPRLVTSEDLKGDALKMRENGYVLLGRSKFQAAPVDEKLALAQARKIGAEVVMVSHKFVQTKSETLPMSTWIPGQEVDQTEHVVVQNGKDQPKVIDHTTTTFTQGEYQTAYVEQSTDYFDYSASFWAKGKAPTFGVNVKALDDQTKSELGTNKGVLVRVVVKDSPAFEADILQGDVLLGFGDTEIRDPDQFFSLVEQNHGKTVSVLLYRNGQNLTKDIPIGMP